MTHSNAKKHVSWSSVEKASPPASIPPRKLSPWFAKLYDKQKEAFEFIISRAATALFCTPGTGKTFISLAVLEHTCPRLALIVAPLTSLGVTWRPKLKTLPHTTLLDGLGNVRDALKTAPRGNHGIIVLTSPRALHSASRRIAKLPWSLVIWDESQNIKDKDSRNSRIARRLRHVPRRLALSGTPVDTGQIDIWAQMRFVDHEVFGEDWRDFSNEYCYRSGWMGKEWKFSQRKQQQFLDALKDHVFRLDDDFLGLKPLQITPVPCLLLGEQRRIYEQMETDQVIELDGVMITAQNAGARDVKLSQITGGAVLDSDDGVHMTGKTKRRKLLHLLRQDLWPVVIFCQFLHEIDIILELFDHESYRVAVIRGSVKEDDRTQIVNDFQSGRYDCLICQVRTGGESIDLTAAATLIIYSMTHSYINFEQVIRRLQRGGQTQQVQAFVLYCIDTIDEVKLDVVKQKSETSSDILSFFEVEEN